MISSALAKRTPRLRDLIDKGFDVGLPYNGTAPDLGAYEFGNITKVFPRKDFPFTERHNESQSGLCLFDALGRYKTLPKSFPTRTPMTITIMRTTTGAFKSRLTSNYRN